VLARVAALSAAAFAILGGVAEASLVSVTRSDVPAMSSDIPKAPNTVAAHADYLLAIAARAGEANAVAVERGPDAFVVRDGAGAAAGAGCAAIDALTVRCATPLGPGAAFVRQLVGGVELADGDDSFRGPDAVASVSAQGDVDAGAGDDVVIGAANALGGPGDDHLAATTADGGPGDDRVEATRADGGDGRDVLGPLAAGSATHLRGGPGDDVLTGGSAADILDGGEGADRLAGGAGDDELHPGPGADGIDGGDGADLASFDDATAPVRADLTAAGPVDPTGEGDAMSAVESLQGGAGDDDLRGDDGANRLDGGGGSDHLDGGGGRDDLGGGDGDDVLAGGGGDDVLVGGLGADRLGGGAGADDLAADDATADPGDRGFVASAADHAPDVVLGQAGRDMLQVGSGDRADAGSGDDRLLARGRPGALACGRGARDVVDAAVLVPRDCERVQVLDFGDSIAARLQVRGARVYIRVPSFLGPEEPTRVTIGLRVAGRLLGRGRRVVPDGASRVVPIRIGRAGLRALHAAGAVRLDVVASDSTSTERDVVVLRTPW
jgi:hypothetical protein